MFFNLGLSIKSHPKAVIECPDGESDIQFALPMNTFVTFAYKLFAVKDTKIDDCVTSNASKLSQFVVQQTMNKIISFNLSFPVTGKFLVELYAASEKLKKDPEKKRENNFMNHVCSYIINCTEAKPNCRALPYTASIKGFGPGESGKEHSYYSMQLLHKGCRKKVSNRYILKSEGIWKMSFLVSH